ncbi:two-component system, NarL family, sensor kinase [Thermoflexales bacterium]|nr:two-component system, NarL family, sensor kinase [Thermoflexales bacterium]
MKQTNLEPGLLSVFRLFALLSLGLRVLEALTMMRSSRASWLDPAESRFVLFTVSAATASVIWLVWPGLPRRLGRFYLPIALLLATVDGLIGGHLELVYAYQHEPGIADALIHLWHSAVMLFVSVALVAWQYPFRFVVAFALGTSLLDMSLKAMLLRGDFTYFESTAHFILARTLLYLVAGYMIVRLMTAQRQQREALARANAQLAHYATTLEELAVSRERNRVARELHDTLAHTLSGTALELEAVKTLWENDPRKARALLDRALSAVRDGLIETRRALQALRAAPLEDLGLSLAVRALAESTAAQIGATLGWQGDARLDRLPATIEQCVYRIAQESLENIARHAAAQQIGVRLGQHDRQLNLEISDNGCGFETSTAAADQHFGLKGMRERAEMVGGRLEIASEPQHGTTIRFSVEIDDDSRPHL